MMIAKTDCYLYSADLSYFLKEFMRSASNNLTQIKVAGLLPKLYSFRTISKSIASKLSKDAEKITINKGKYLLRQGESIDTIFIIASGSLSYGSEKFISNSDQNILFEEKMFTKINEELKSQYDLIALEDSLIFALSFFFYIQKLRRKAFKVR